MEVLSEIRGYMGWLTLNRPQALNALSLWMIRELETYLKIWEENPSIKAVVIQGTGEKAFCAGGDIRAVYNAKAKGNLQLCDDFFREEYALNATICRYTKPCVALMDGITMGGGLGIAVAGSSRIVTERSLLAMPETSIGLFPDAGATTFLNAIPGVTGLYLGLTGTRIKAADALWTGLATHFMPSSSLPLFKIDLAKGKSLEESLVDHCKPLEEKGLLEHHQQDIENHFRYPSLQQIMQSLEKDLSPFAQNTCNTLRSKSPTSLAITFRQLKRGPLFSFKERIEQEFRLSQQCIRGHDFMEGIRALLIDKDRLPRWNPQTLEDLKEQDLDSYFSY